MPTVGGEAVFDEAYRDNCLVNAMCVGLLPVERVMRAKATGSGQVIVLYGATTGRDGIGGASVLASQELDGSTEKRPSVQIGDPFTGKKLIEASVELVRAGLVESLQDCGAAGIASALSEMAADYGIDVHLDRVPQREEGMEPWEVMISESQERMVAIVRPQMLEAVERVLDRWELGHSVIGEVTASGELRAFWQDELVGEIPARFLTEDCPRYDVILEPRAATPEREIPDPPGVVEALPALLASPNLRSREFVFRRYDQLVGSRTVRRPGLDAAVLRLRPSLRGLALSLDGQGRVARLDPFIGGALAVLEAARNVACAGGEPLGFTDCLNFGNPEKPEIGWELAEAIDGMAAACDALGLPIVSGNVSLYNETNGRAIHPDAGRRRGRSRAGRAARAQGLARGRLRAARRGFAALARRLGVPGALRSRSAAHPARSTSRRRRDSSPSSGRSRRSARSSTTPRKAGSPSVSRRRRSSPESAPS